MIAKLPLAYQPENDQMPLQKARANATPDQNAPAEKLTRQSRTRSLVATAEQTFDYSDGDWVKIERAIESVRQIR